MAGYIKGITIDIGGNTTKLDAALKTSDASARKLQTSLRSINAGLKLDPKNTELLAQKQEILGQKVAQTTQRLVQLRAAQGDVDKAYANKEIDNGQYLAFRRDIELTENQLKKYKLELEQVSASQVQAALTASKFGDALLKASAKADTYIASGKAITMGLTLPIIAVGAYSIKSAAEFESSFAGVRKTTEATEAQFKSLMEYAKKASEEKVISANQVNDVMALGSQLGIYIENLESFANVVADLDVSTNLSAEEAAMDIAQYANITHMAQTEASNWGSAVVDLGNNMATTEAKIAGMTMRIAGQGSQVGFTHQQMLALSAAISSVGLEEEMAGTAVSLTLARINRDVAKSSETLDTWASMAGMSIADFKKAWEIDAFGAFQKVLSGMGSVSSEGGNLTLVLDELGISAARQTDLMNRLSGASDLLGSAVGIANTAWAENTALTKEAEARYMTTESQAAMLQHRLENTAATMGGPLLASVNGIIDSAEPFLDFLRGAAVGFAEMDESQRNGIVAMALAAASIGPVLYAGGKLLKVTEAAIKGYRTLAAAVAAESAARAASMAVTTADTGAAVANAAAKTALAKAQTAFNVAVKANPLAVYLVALTALYTVLKSLEGVYTSSVEAQGGYTAQTKEQKANVDALAESYKEIADAQGESSNEALRAKAAMDEATASYESQKQTISRYVESLNESLAKTKDNISTLKEQMDEADSAAGSILNLSDKITALSNVQDKDSSQRSQMTSLVTALNTQVKGLNLSYDVQADKLNMTTESMKKYAAAAADNARYQAQQKAYNGMLEEEANLTAKLAAAKKEFEGMTPGAGLYFDDNNYIGTQLKNYKNAEQAVKGLEDELAKVQSMETFTLEQLEQTEAGSTAFEGLTDSAGNYNEALASLSEQAQKNVDELTALRDEMDWFDNAMERAGVSSEDLAVRLEESGLSVADLKDEMASFFDVSTAGFSDLDIASETSAQQFMDNLTEWVQASQTFSDNIVSLYSNAGSTAETEFVKYLESLGVKGALIAQNLVDGTGPSLQALAELYASAGDESAKKFLEGFDTADAETTGGEYTEATAQGMANLEKLNKIDAASQSIAKTAADTGKPLMFSGGRSTGAEFVNGAIVGVQQNSYRLYSQIRALVSSATSAARVELDIHSPSKRTAKEIGAPFVEGIITGIKSQESNLHSAVAGLMESSTRMEMRSPVISEMASTATTNNYYSVGNVDLTGDTEAEEAVRTMFDRLARLGGMA